MLSWMFKVAEPLLVRACLTLSDLAGARRHFYTDSDPYLTRYYFLKRRRGFGVYLHHFHRGDDDGALHNHPSWHCSVVLTNGFVEERWNPETRDVETRNLLPGSISVVRPGDFHRLRLIDRKRGAWTLLVAGRRVQESWAFWWPGSGGYAGYVPHFNFFRSRIRYGRPC